MSRRKNSYNVFVCGRGLRVKVAKGEKPAALVPVPPRPLRLIVIRSALIVDPIGRSVVVGDANGNERPGEAAWGFAERERHPQAVAYRIDEF